MSLLEISLDERHALVKFTWTEEYLKARIVQTFYESSDARMSENTLQVHQRDFIYNYEKIFHDIIEKIGEENIDFCPGILNIIFKLKKVRDDLKKPTEYRDINSIQEDLEQNGWGATLPNSEIRKLKDYQVENISKMSSMAGAATFSVPGAGKTTEVLAYHALRSGLSSPFLVIAPLNAFSAWEEGIAECYGNDHNLTRLSSRNIEVELSNLDNKKFIINYDQVSIEENLFLLQQFLMDKECPLYIDESHRIKNSISKRYLAISRLAIHASDKVIMTGTPMPQSTEDLVSQYNAIYPEDPILDEQEAVERFKPIFVRTPKNRLGLPELIINEPIKVQMNPIQSEIYQLLIGEICALHSELNLSSRAYLRDLGKPILRLLMFLSNPSLVKDYLIEKEPNLASSLIEEGNGPKVDKACELARDLVDRGEKVLIWSSFRENVEIVSELLDDLGSEFIHGGVKVGNEDDIFYREGKIKKFKEDKNTNILVANPASAGEGISLHMVCHNAIYIDRTFNAAQYIQSQDRIHRIGLPQDQKTNIHLIQLAIDEDEYLNDRLNEKISAMNSFLNNTSLEPTPVDLTDVTEPTDSGVLGVDEDDIDYVNENFIKNDVIGLIDFIRE